MPLLEEFLILLMSSVYSVNVSIKIRTTLKLFGFKSMGKTRHGVDAPIVYEGMGWGGGRVGVVLRLCFVFI